ncbi:MAG: spore coat protein U domain-containing protein [Syntrophales bacterium]
MKRFIISGIVFIFTLIGTGTCLALSCTFGSHAQTVPFGTLDPSSSANATATVTVTIRCTGSNSTWTLTSNNGLHYSGTTRRMQNTNVSTQYLPYSLTFSPTTGNKATTSTTGSGTILNSDYINAYVGSYSDTVTITISP